MPHEHHSLSTKKRTGDGRHEVSRNLPAYIPHAPAHHADHDLFVLLVVAVAPFTPQPPRRARESLDVPPQLHHVLGAQDVPAETHPAHVLAPHGHEQQHRLRRRALHAPALADLLQQLEGALPAQILGRDAARRRTRHVGAVQAVRGALRDEGQPEAHCALGFPAVGIGARTPRGRYAGRTAHVGKDVRVGDEFVQHASRGVDHARVVTSTDADGIRHAADLLDAALVHEVERLGQADLVPEDELDLAACGFALGRGGAALEEAELDVALDAKGLVEREDGGAHGVDGDVAGGGGGRDAAFAVEHDVKLVFCEGREQGERDEPPGGAAAGTFARYLVADDAAHCAEAFCAAGDEARSVDEGGARHRELDLRAVCDGIEEADEVCLGGCETWACGRGADLGDADWAAGEGGEEEPRGEVAVAFELKQRLNGFVGHSCGRAIVRVVEGRNSAQSVGGGKYAFSCGS